MEKRPCREENIDSSEAQHATDEEGSSSESESEEQQCQRVPVNSSSCKKREPLVVTKPHRQLCRSPCLDRPSFSQNSTVQDFREDETNTGSGIKLASDREYQSKMEFALKLGYSGEQVETVLSKLGAAALINDILAELVRLGNKVEPESQTCSSTATITSRSPCVKETVSPEVSLEEESVETFDNLRPIVIDGSNVAMRYDTNKHLICGCYRMHSSCATIFTNGFLFMRFNLTLNHIVLFFSHGNKEVFSCRGIQLAVEWFREKAHKDITVFVPAWRKEQSRPDAIITGNKAVAIPCHL